MKPIDQQNDAEFGELVGRAAALPEVPGMLTRNVMSLWQASPLARRGDGPRTADAVTALDAAGRRLRALLSFDSWSASPLAHGLRSAATETRHLLFAAEGCDIDLRISRAGAVWSVAGQVLGPEESGAVELARELLPAEPEATILRAPLDPLGEFHLAGVAAGTYVLRLNLGEDRIELPPIDVGDRR